MRTPNPLITSAKLAIDHADDVTLDEATYFLMRSQALSLAAIAQALDSIADNGVNVYNQH